MSLAPIVAFALAFGAAIQFLPTPAYAQQTLNCSFNSFQHFDQFRSDADKSNQTTQKPANDDRLAEHLAQRNALIAELTEYLDTVDWRQDPSTNQQVVISIRTLGEMRAVEAAGTLANFLDFRDSGKIIGGLDPGRDFPAIPALLNIGTPSFSAVAAQLGGVRQVNNIAARNGLWILAKLETPRRFDIKALRVRLEKEKQSTGSKGCRDGLQRIILRIDALNELKGQR
jgi:hypothetical protein